MNVLRILKNPVYKGILIQGRETTPNYKVKKRITKDKSKWSKVEKNHEAIISPVDFDNVQDLLRMDTRTGNTEEKVYFFIRDCAMRRLRREYGQKNSSFGKEEICYYVCANHKSDKLSAVHIASMRRPWREVF